MHGRNHHQPFSTSILIRQHGEVAMLCNPKQPSAEALGLSKEPREASVKPWRHFARAAFRPHSRCPSRGECLEWPGFRNCS